MQKPRVLVDLSLAHKSLGHSGIPQDSRLLFAGLCQSPHIDPTGLLWSTKQTWSGAALSDLESQAIFLGPHINDLPVSYSIARKALNAISPRLLQLYGEAQESLTGRHALHDLRPEMPREIVWRNFFASTVDPKRRQALLANPFVLSGLGLARLARGALGVPGPSAKLDTDKYDFVIFQDSKKVRVSKNTTKIIRYHDAIPLFDSDTAPGEWTIKLHYRSVKAAAKDSLYVCNSTSSRDELGRLAPHAAEKATVIPYFVPRVERAVPTVSHLKEIASLRFSGTATRSTTMAELQALKQDCIQTWFGRGPDVPAYIMTLSTIEPRKNILGLIAAWQRLRAKHPALRLLIVGKPGWQYEETLEGMRSFIEAGQILHLERVAQREIQYLYSGARCFVFPSFSEGFGLPPVEAMQCGTPTVVSNVPAHRYMAGDASLFCDPYDRADIAAKIDQVLSTDISRELTARGYRNAKRFTEAAVLPLWEEFFDKHRNRSQGRQGS